MKPPQPTQLTDADVHLLADRILQMHGDHAGPRAFAAFAMAVYAKDEASMSDWVRVMQAMAHLVAQEMAAGPLAH